MFTNINSLEIDDTVEGEKKVKPISNSVGYTRTDYFDKFINKGDDICGNCHWFNRGECDMLFDKRVTVNTASCSQFQKESY